MRPGLGFLPALVPLISAASSAYAAKQQTDAAKATADANAPPQLRPAILRAQMEREAAASATRTKWLIAGGVVVALGVAFLIARKRASR